MAERRGPPQEDIDAGLVASYTSIKDATPEEMRKSMAGFNKMATPQQQAERVLRLFGELKDCFIGNHVDMMEHGLQTATRALRDGADEETVVVALLHDIGEVMSPINHGEVAAAFLRPYISPQNHWILMHHEIFQAFYYQDAAGLTEKKTRERFSDSKYYAACVKFCHDWDQVSFDPDYDSFPLEHFVPMVHRLFQRKPYWHSEHGDCKVAAAKMTIAAGYPSDGRVDHQEATAATPPPEKRQRIDVA